ncbi:MAG: hypothetical protein HY567_01805 [Candidatus Kerfeldbacteria bacterium]|nr:hypothetical protein [Candidatus Kerfeldbacteria bacterium]
MFGSILTVLLGCFASAISLLALFGVVMNRTVYKHRGWRLIELGRKGILLSYAAIAWGMYLVLPALASLDTDLVSLIERLLPATVILFIGSAVSLTTYYIGYFLAPPHVQRQL